MHQHPLQLVFGRRCPCTRCQAFIQSNSSRKRQAAQRPLSAASQGPTAFSTDKQTCRRALQAHSASHHKDAKGLGTMRSGDSGRGGLWKLRATQCQQVLCFSRGDETSVARHASVHACTRPVTTTADKVKCQKESGKCTRKMHSKCAVYLLQCTKFASASSREASSTSTPGSGLLTHPPPPFGPVGPAQTAWTTTAIASGDPLKHSFLDPS